MGVGTPYLPLPPPTPPRKAMPRQERAWRLGGVVGEGAGKIGHRRAPFYLPSLGTTPKKTVPGEGG